MQFKPNFNLLKSWDEVTDVISTDKPYCAVYKKNGKTLVYIAAHHFSDNTLNLINFCFGGANISIPKPGVVVVEREAENPIKSTDKDEAVYLAKLAIKNGADVVYADPPMAAMLYVLNNRNKTRNLTMDDLYKILHAKPAVNGNENERMGAELNMFCRNRFHLLNIAAALNKYDVVFCAFGEGHFREQSLVLEDMMGKPEFIVDAPQVEIENVSDIKEFERVKIVDTKEIM